MKGGLFLDIVVGEGTAIFELFTGEDEALLVGRNAFLVCNRGLVGKKRKAGKKMHLGSWILHCRLCLKTPPRG